MSIHKWRRLPTKYFGEVWVPFAHIQLKDSTGKLHALSLQIDSGAVVSLLSRSVADLLQVDLEKGHRVELGSVGGAATVAYVHSIETVFTERMRFPVRFAIADTENVPNLLGRLDVFDRLQLDFDATLNQTHIMAPWLDEDQRRIYEFLIETEQHILERWPDLGLPDPAPEVLRRLVHRMGQLYVSAVGLVKLHRPYSGPLYIRAMFEVWLQLEFILRDPAERAKRYLEFEHVTRYLRMNAIVKNPSGPIGQRLASSPRCDQGQARNKREYDRVRPLFEYTTKAGKKKDAKNWYKMRIDELADSLGFAGEYRFVYAACSDWAHANPSRSREEDPFAEPEWILLTCTGLYARMLKSIADAAKIFLTNEQYQFLAQASKQRH